MWRRSAHLATADGALVNKCVCRARFVSASRVVIVCCRLQIAILLKCRLAPTRTGRWIKTFGRYAPVTVSRKPAPMTDERRLYLFLALTF